MQRAAHGLGGHRKELVRKRKTPGSSSGPLVGAVGGVRPFFFCFFPSSASSRPCMHRPPAVPTKSHHFRWSRQPIVAEVCTKPVRCRTSHSGFSSWHLCRSNCSCRLAWASVTRRSVLSGAVNCLPHAVQAATHGTVPRCLTILTARFVMTLFAVEGWETRLLKS